MFCSQLALNKTPECNLDLALLRQIHFESKFTFINFKWHIFMYSQLTCEISDFCLCAVALYAKEFCCSWVKSIHHGKKFPIRTTIPRSEINLAYVTRYTNIRLILRRMLLVLVNVFVLQSVFLFLKLISLSKLRTSWAQIRY